MRAPSSSLSTQRRRARQCAASLLFSAGRKMGRESTASAGDPSSCLFSNEYTGLCPKQAHTQTKCQAYALLTPCRPLVDPL
eukprot:1193640-Prorocentrum_minimum.AAC.3